MNWLKFFGGTFFLSGIICFFIICFLKNKNKKFFRIGGVAIISSFVLGLLFSSKIALTNDWRAVLIGSVLILFFGLWDDFKDINWKYQLFFQFLLALLLIFFGYEIKIISFLNQEIFRLDFWQINLLGISISIFSSILIIFWLIGIINAVNWLDGSDGLLAISGILSLIVVLAVSLRPEVNQPALVFISLMAIGSLIGFLIFNFPRAKIEAGTSGSYFIGFLLASLAIVAGTKIITAMIILILPVTDFIWVIFERIKNRQSIFKKDKNQRHLHYQLLNRGFSSFQILIGYAIFLTVALIGSLLVVNQFQKIILLGAEFSAIILLRIFLIEKFNLEEGKINFKNILIKPIFWLILIILFLMMVSVWQKRDNFLILKPEQEIQINSRILKVEIAQNDEERYQGLSGIKKIPVQAGMLFLYEKVSFCPHVMRNMLFDLDFIFMRDGRVVFIQERVDKNFKGVIQSPVLCNQVLEINAGEIEKMNIKIGDKMQVI